jgi:hypothetical protein
MKLRRVLFVMCVLCAAPVLAAAQESAANGAVRQMLVDAGAPAPVSMTVPDRGRSGQKSLRLAGVSVLGATVMLHLRCFPRKDCGDVIATLKYASVDDAQTAQAALLKIARQHTRPPPAVVRAGARVSLLFQGHRMKLRLWVQALNSGAVGGRIRVRDEETRDIYFAVVTGPGEAEGEL